MLVNRACALAAEYGQIKLVAAMMNGRKHWFAQGASPAAGSLPGGGGGLTSTAAAAGTVGDKGVLAPLNCPAPLDHGDAAAAQHFGACEPDAKRPRPSGCAGQGSAAPLPPLDRAALTAWLAARGGATAPQLVAHFCRSDGQAAAGQAQRETALAGLLGALCEDFDIMRKGGDSGFSSAIDLADREVVYLVI